MDFELYALQDKYTNSFLGFGPEDTNFGLELTKNYGTDSYNLGSGFGHFALALPDVYKAVDSIKAAGDLPCLAHICMKTGEDCTRLSCR